MLQSTCMMHTAKLCWIGRISTYRRHHVYSWTPVIDRNSDQFSAKGEEVRGLEMSEAELSISSAWAITYASKKKKKKSRMCLPKMQHNIKT